MDILYYEAHITVGNKIGFKDYSRLGDLVCPKDWKITDMYDDTLTSRHSLDMDVDGTIVLTFRSGNNPLPEIYPWMVAKVREDVHMLRNAGFKVERFKVEATVLDTEMENKDKKENVGVALTA